MHQAEIWTSFSAVSNTTPYDVMKHKVVHIQSDSRLAGAISLSENLQPLNVRLILKRVNRHAVRHTKRIIKTLISSAFPGKVTPLLPSPMGKAERFVVS